MAEPIKSKLAYQQMLLDKARVRFNVVPIGQRAMLHPEPQIETVTLNWDAFQHLLMEAMRDG